MIKIQTILFSPFPDLCTPHSGRYPRQTISKIPSIFLSFRFAAVTSVVRNPNRHKNNFSGICNRYSEMELAVLFVVMNRLLSECPYVPREVCNFGTPLHCVYAGILKFKTDLDHSLTSFFL